MRITNIFKGVLIGIGLIVPGLSGSVLAIILGLYKNMLIAVTELKTNFKKSMIFLMPIGLGAVLGVLASASLVNEVIIRFPVFSYAFFIGLMFGASPLVLRKMNILGAKSTITKNGTKEKLNFLNIIFMIAAFAFIMLLAADVDSDEHIAIHYLSSLRDFIDLFIAGLITLSLMAVPGISGSMIIMVLGQFGTVYNAVAAVPAFLIAILREPAYAMELFTTVALLIPFMIGAIIGILSIAKIMVWLLNNYEKTVYYAVFGAVLGTITALARIGMGGVNMQGNLFLYVIIALLWLTLGFLFTIYLDSRGLREDE
ncbi:MAG: DUF368 domain-containing protein [Defluviitaleaceae bacterium]|nr:DUF368 domain-containing protein [Defluviitaleaceae bacterium]